MPFFGVANPPQAIADIFGSVALVPHNTDITVWTAAESLIISNSSGEGITTDGVFQISIEGYNWCDYTVRAGFGIAANGTDNGVGYRAIGEHFDQTTGDAVARILGASTAAGIFSGFNGTVVNGRKILYSSTGSHLIEPCFQHTAGIGVELDVYFNVYIHAYN